MKITGLLVAVVAAVAVMGTTPAFAAGKGDCDQTRKGQQIRKRDGSGGNCMLQAGKNGTSQGKQDRKRDGTGPNCKK